MCPKRRKARSEPPAILRNCSIFEFSRNKKREKEEGEELCKQFQRLYFKL
jgi:hypothetical protein